jgi:ABC-type amino acid transport substrate-binding protein
MKKSSDNNRELETHVDGKEHAHYLKELSIRLSHNTNIRIATLIVIVLFAITTTWTISGLIVGDVKQELEGAKAGIQKLKNKYDVLLRDNEIISTSYYQIKKHEKIPILISPVNKRPIIGRYVTFNWKYSTDPGFQNLILEIIKIDGEGIKERRFQIPEPGRENMFFEFHEGARADFFWRIGTGELLNDQDGTRLWSRYGSFSLYPSVLDKIEATNELVVGTTAKFLSYDRPITCEGDPDDFDIEYIRWVASKLNESLVKESLVKERPDLEGPDLERLVKERLVLEGDIELRIKYVKWDKLFTSVMNGNVDIAIANITKSDTREQENLGLTFTSGYRKNSQVLIRKKKTKSEHDSLKMLAGSTVGAQMVTINLKAANYLAETFKFNVLGEYSSYADVINAVTNSEIDYGIIDSVLWESVNYPELEKLDIELDEYLKMFNRNELGSDLEEYAIAASAKSSNRDFVERLNRIIKNSVKSGIRDEIIDRRSNLKNVDREDGKFDCS